jgi:large subunit ribosomal protein L10
MPQPDKIKKVEELSNALGDAKSIFLTDFTGLTVAEMTDLRREFRKQNVEYVVVKNTLAKRSAREVGIEDVLPYLNGPTGLAIAKEDPVAPVRVIWGFKEKIDKPTIKGAVVEGQFIGQQAAEDMRKIPTRDVLLGKVVSALNSPISGFVGGLNSMMTKLVYALDQIKEQKES